MRRSYTIPIVLILLLTPIGAMVAVDVTGIDLQAAGPPTRTIVQESESNNDWASADQLTASGTYELHGNISSGSDQDMFYINLNGGNGPLVDRATFTLDYMNTSDSNNILFIIIYAFYPDNVNHDIDDEIVLDLQYYYTIFPFWTPATFDAGYTGKYGIRLVAQDASSGGQINEVLEYNFTVSVNQVAPVDSNNDQSNPQTVTSGLISNGMDQNQDFMEWYRVDAPHSIYPTILDLTVNPVNPVPQQITGGIDYGIQIDMYVRYNSRSNPGTFTQIVRRLSPHPTFQTAGLLPTPYDYYLEVNCTEIQFGFVLSSFGIESRNPNINQKQLTTLNANTGLNINLDLSANIPNKRPQLSTASVDKIIGRSNDEFIFSVLYRDPQNETPKAIDLWKSDGGAPEFFRSLGMADGESLDHTQWVRYETTVMGSQIGPDGLYKFNISATDGKDFAVDPASGLHEFYVKIDNNLPPTSDVLKRIDISEDSETIWINLDELFTDLDGKMTYTIWDEASSLWKLTTKNNFVKSATILNNGTEIAPEWRLRVQLEENVNGLKGLRINGTDDGVFPKSVEVVIMLNVIGENDPPTIDYINSMSRKTLGDEYRLRDEYQDEMVEIRVVASDIDVGDELQYHWTIADVLHSPVRGVNYDWNESSGDLWFIPSDGDVPGFDTRLIVSDGNGGTDSFDIIVTVKNVNDAPWIIVPKERSTIEGEYLYINPVYGDPDMDSNDFITFSYDLGTLDMYTPPTSIEFSQTTGRLVLEATEEEMNGEWEINITIVDGFGEADWGICKVTIGNVNDPPSAYPINIDQQEENLTVTFFTLEAEDEDEDETLIYIWDFGDGSAMVQGEDLRSVSHTFPTEGAYSVTLTVFDGETRSEMREVFLQVSAPPRDPDLDDDSMLDEWEVHFGLDPNDPEDALLDLDDDGLTNLQEFQYYEDTGNYLNPWNPDTDEDGFDDGEELNNGYDPLDPSRHPDDPNEGISILLWLGGLVLVLLMLLAALVFVVMRIRNRPKPVAAVAQPVAAYSNQPELAPGYYDQIPSADMEYLPPAEGTYDQITYDQNFYPGQQQWEQQPVPGQYPEQSDQLYQPELPQPQADLPMEQTTASPVQEDIYGYHEPMPQPVMEPQVDQPLFDSPLGGTIQPSVPETVENIPGQEPPQMEEGPAQVMDDNPIQSHQPPVEETEKKEEGKKEEVDGLPPPPTLPDL